jgi:multiple sugar transport system substrate-binding protein
MKGLWKRFVLTLAVSLLASAGVPACAPGSSNQSSSDLNSQIANVTDAQLKGVHIQLSRFFGDCTSDFGTNLDLSKAVGECATITTLLNKFNAENKWGIQVTRLGGAVWDTYYLTLNAAIAGGTPPDVAIMHGSSLVDYAKRGLLVPLDPLVGITHVDLNDVVPAAKIAISYNGQNYAIPFDVNGALLHLNLDIWKQAGLLDASGNPVLPKSADELLADAAKVKQTTGKKFLAIPRIGDHLGVHLFETLLEQQGGYIVNDQGTKSGLDSPQSRTALAFENKLFDAGFANGNQTYDAANQSFLRGEVAAEFNGTWLVDTFRTSAPFNYRVVSMPTLYSKPAVWSDNHLWAIPKQPKSDPAKYRAALELVSYLFAHNKDWALGTGHISVRPSVLSSPEYKAAPQRANYADTASTVAHPVPHISNWPAASDALYKAIESIWFQHVPVDQALKQGDDAINSALQT